MPEDDAQQDCEGRNGDDERGLHGHPREMTVAQLASLAPPRHSAILLSMTPEQYEKALSDAQSFTRDANRLFKQACPNDEDRSTFQYHMLEAKRKGMTWVQGLRYVVEQRKIVGEESKWS